MGLNPHSMTEGGEGRREEERRNVKRRVWERGKRERKKEGGGEREYESDSKLISHTTQKLVGYDPQTVYPSCPIQSKVWVA